MSGGLTRWRALKRSNILFGSKTGYSAYESGTKNWYLLNLQIAWYQVNRHMKEKGFEKQAAG